MLFDFDDLDVLESLEHTSAEIATADACVRSARVRQDDLEASRQRILAAAGDWHKVLRISPTANVEDVRRAFHELALLHHPDKCIEHSTDAHTDVFRIVRGAYEQALAAAAAPAAPRLAVVTVGVARQPAYPVSPTAARDDIRQAVDDWEHASDFGDEVRDAKTMPDEVSHVSAEEAAAWLAKSACLAVDVREEHERWGAPLPGAVFLSYLQLLKTPERASRQVARLREDGRPLVVYSNKGFSHGSCGMACALLLDVFAFDPALVHRLDGGYAIWCRLKAPR